MAVRAMEHNSGPGAVRAVANSAGPEAVRAVANSTGPGAVRAVEHNTGPAAVRAVAHRFWPGAVRAVEYRIGPGVVRAMEHAEAAKSLGSQSGGVESLRGWTAFLDNRQTTSGGQQSTDPGDHPLRGAFRFVRQLVFAFYWGWSLGA